jgi:nicotinate-nucleotide pyrophosphorylase (carboxylating)
MWSPQIDQLIDLALEEDLGRGDLTSESIFAADATCKGAIVAKQPGGMVLAAIEIAARVFRRVDPSLHVEVLVQDGTHLPTRTPVLTVAGRTRAVLMAERTALNFVQRASGIATATRKYVELIAGTRAQIVDTRKTAPGFRLLDKAAVRAGGGHNHRADLASGVLIKDNHVAACGGVRAAIERARSYAPHTVKIECEVTTFAELDEALAARADIVLLDNMTPDDVRRAVQTIAGRALVEVSGGITHETVRAYAEAGPDLISIGALTHSVKAADLSLEV